MTGEERISKPEDEVAQLRNDLGVTLASLTAVVDATGIGDENTVRLTATKAASLLGPAAAALTRGQFLNTNEPTN